MHPGLTKIVGPLTLNMKQAGCLICMSITVTRPTGCLTSRRDGQEQGVVTG